MHLLQSRADQQLQTMFDFIMPVRKGYHNKDNQAGVDLLHLVNISVLTSVFSLGLVPTLLKVSVHGYFDPNTPVLFSINP